MESVHNIVIQLIRYILTGKEFNVGEDVDYNLVYNFSKEHGIENIVYEAIKELNIKLPEKIDALFAEDYDANIMLEATQALELENLAEEFEKAEIDYMPMKGSVVKYLYAMPDYRKSGDIDILIRPEDKKRANELILKMDYILDEFDEFEHHIGYRKPPCIILELHDKLVEKGNRSYKYLSQIWDRVVKEDKCNCRYKMTKEDFYTYSISHLAKHIKICGAGIKFITDIYVMKNKWEFDENKLKIALKAANVYELNCLVNELIGYWFNGEECSDNAKTLGEFILNSGMFGNKEQRFFLSKGEAVSKGMIGKLKYRIDKRFRGVFAPYDVMRREYPIVLKKKYLIPFFWMIRIFKIMTNKELREKNLNKALVIEEDNKKYSDLWRMVKDNG